MYNRAVATVKNAQRGGCALWGLCFALHSRLPGTFPYKHLSLSHHSLPFLFLFSSTLFGL